MASQRHIYNENKNTSQQRRFAFELTRKEGIEMFNFMKKNFIKNNKNRYGGKKISTATMSSDEYIKAVENEILPCWADKELMNKTGINDLFTEDSKIVNNLSYEDACDCVTRALKMVDMATYVCEEFGKRSDVMKTASENDRDAFYSANTIKNLFIEAQANVDVSQATKPANLDEAINRLNKIIKSFECVKKITFVTIIGLANTSFAEMTGF